MESNIRERKLKFKNYNLRSGSFKKHNLKSTNYQNHILENNKGITLIALIVTIIVLLILAGVSISAIWGGEGIFSRTTEVAFKTELAKIKEEYEIYIADKMLENMDFQRETLSAYVTSLYYDGMPKDEVGNIYTVLKNSKREEVGKFEITKGELYYASPDENERKWAQDLGIKLNPYIVRDGVLLSSDANLGLTGDNTGTLVIPETVGGKPVTSIGAGAFGLTEGIRKIVIPPTVTEIRDNAFYNNTSLEEIEFQTKIENGVEIGLKTIRTNAFRGCTSLLEVEIPDTVTEIESNAFRSCGKLRAVKLSNNIDKISNQVFQSCYSLTSIEIPDSVTSIGDTAFGYCSALERVKMSKKVSNIAGVFTNCPKLIEIDVEGNPNFTFENGILFNKNKTKMQFVLSTAISENTFEVPNTVTSIEKGLIDAYKTQIKKVIIPASVTSLNFRFFTNNIDTIEIKEGGPYKESGGRIYSTDGTTLYYIYKQGTTLAKNIQSITIEDTIKTIGRYALVNCNNLTEINIGKNVTNINYSWIWNEIQTKLTTITIPEENSAYTVEGTAIYNKNKTKLIGVAGRVTKFEIPDSVAIIGTEAFYMQKISNISIPNSVTEIQNTPFRYSTVEEISIPNSVTKIASDAFIDCSKLKSIIIDNKLGSIPDPKNNNWGAGTGDRMIHWLRSEKTK